MSKPISVEKPRVVIVTGPTASGKTELGIRLAEKFDGEIINADSMQVYRFLDIGTAKATPEQRARVPHHLLDIVTPDAVYSAGTYAQDAARAAEAILARGKRVFVVGGTGLYIRAFVYGLIDAGGADTHFRNRLEAEHREAVSEGDPQRLHRRLKSVDPEAAARIHPHDLRRQIRALELAQRSHKSVSAIRGEHGFAEPRYRALQLALDPGVEELKRRIDLRCAQMIEQGLLQEVRNLYRSGYGPELRSMQGIGYRHMAPVVEGTNTLANVLVEMQRDTREFARRQRTWLRKVPDAIWMDPTDEAAIFEKVAAFYAS